MQASAFNPVYQHFCSGATVLADGKSLIVGGNASNGVLQSGLMIISVSACKIGECMRDW